MIIIFRLPCLKSKKQRRDPPVLPRILLKESGEKEKRISILPGNIPDTYRLLINIQRIKEGGTGVQPNCLRQPVSPAFIPANNSLSVY
jgi:hypothetical protein